MKQKILNNLKGLLTFLFYRIEFSGKKDFKGNPRFVYKPRKIPMFFFVLIIGLVFSIYDGIRTFIVNYIDSFDEVNRTLDYSSYVKKDGENNWDLYRKH